MKECEKMKTFNVLTIVVLLFLIANVSASTIKVTWSDGNTKYYDTNTCSDVIIVNGYGDDYRMKMLRDRANYQAFRGNCSYRGFALSGCSTTGDVVMMRLKGTDAMLEHFSLMSTSLRWGTDLYVLNDVFRWLNDSVMAGYENWYPFDMSCSVAMYLIFDRYGTLGKSPFRGTSSITVEEY
jgi:hypothetical protein